MPKPSLGDRLQYAFDSFMTRGTLALLAGLALLAALLIFLVAGAVVLANQAPNNEGLFELAWMGLLRTLDTGTMGGDTGSPFFLLAMLVVTLGGVFTVSTLIGILNNGLEDKLAELRQGRSRVIEANHTVILGWSEQVFSILSELVVANANQPRSCIVILGDKDKVEMETEIRDRLGSTGRTRVICRSGSPIDPVDIRLVSLDTARAIIVLAPAGDDPDAGVIKTLLAITNNPARRPEPYHIVAEISQARNQAVARMVGRDEVEVVLVGELIARIIAQTCRQSGLSVVYTELLNFEGDEIYFQAEPSLAGRTYGEALSAYRTSTVIGLQPAGGQPHLNPPMDTRLQAQDRLILIAEDDDKIQLAEAAAAQTERIHNPIPLEARPERTLILGWNGRATFIVNELDHYVAPGSELLVVAEAEGVESALQAQCGGVRNQTVRFQPGDTTDRSVLDGLRVADYNHVIVLADADRLEAQAADARTLITLLHLRDIAERIGRAVSVVSEMLDVRNRNLAEVTRADDFIVSDRLISLILAQVAENKALNAVFADLFDPEGAEVYLRPAAGYVQLGTPVSFYTVVEAARRRGETAIGYRRKASAGDPAQDYGVKVNPNKAEPITFAEADRVIVLAEQ